MGATSRLACVLVLTASAALASPRRAVAQSTCRARLTLSTPKNGSTCPSEREVRDAVAGRLGYDPFCDDADQELRVAIRREIGRYTGELTLRDARGVPRGRRDLGGDASCEQLAVALTLAISIALDPLGAARAEAGVPPAAPAAPPASGPAPAPEPSAGAAATPPALELVAGGGVSAGGLPRAGGAVELGAAALWPRWSVELAAAVTPPVTAPAAEGTVRAWEAGLVASPCRRGARFEGCVALAAGMIAAEGRGIFHSRRAAAPYGWAGVRGGVHLPLSRKVSAVLSGTVGLSVVRARVMVSDAEVWRSPAVRWGAGLGVAWRP